MPYYKDQNSKVHFLDNSDYEYLLPAGSVQITDAEARTLNYRAPTKSDKLNEIEMAYQAAIQQPISYMGTTFQADKDSQDLMAKTITGLQAIVAIGQAIPADFGWWDTTNNKVTMTLAQLQGLFAAGVFAVNTAFSKKQALKAMARAAITQADLDAIVW